MQLRGPRGLINRAKRRVGRRGSALIFLAVVSAALAIGVVGSPPASYRGVELIAPPAAWAVAWGAAAALSLVSAFIHADRIAYAVNATLYAAWGAGLGLGWVIQGNARGWLGAVVYGALAGFTVMVAGWPEDPRL